MMIDGGARAVYAPIRNLMLYVTEDCNLRCSYCFVPKQPRRMSIETARKAVDFLLHRNITGAEQRPSITFFGGEPFTELDVIEEVVRYARQRRSNNLKRIRFSATTNGTVANERVRGLLQSSGMRLLVSMDGDHGASTHRPFASGRSSYEAVSRNLPRLVQWATDVMVRVTYHPASLDLLGSVRHVLSLGARSIALCPHDEADWAGHEEHLERAYMALGDWYIEEARAGRTLVLGVTNTYLRQYHAWRTVGARPLRPCAVGTSIIGVDVDGNVMPCHRFLNRPADRLGHVEQPRFDVEKRAPFVHLASRDILGCDTCIANTVCGGGCRAVALNAGRGLHGAHPSHCVNTRAHARALFRIYDTLTAESNPVFALMLGAGDSRSSALTELAYR